MEGVHQFFIFEMEDDELLDEVREFPRRSNSLRCLLNRKSFNSLVSC